VQVDLLLLHNDALETRIMMMLSGAAVLIVCVRLRQLANGQVSPCLLINGQCTLV
jgi:hypothetical protein